jgi:hypothetical protein
MCLKNGYFIRKLGGLRLMTTFLKKMTLLLVFAFGAQAPMHALWGWGSTQTTSPSNTKSSWTSWLFGGAAITGIYEQIF